jgi:hypothetical protein
MRPRKGRHKFFFFAGAESGIIIRKKATGQRSQELDTNVELRGITKKFGAVTAVNDVSQIKRGEATAIYGQIWTETQSGVKRVKYRDLIVTAQNHEGKE